ncbi:hypothetical protein ALC57_09270 [Trachymyrmex cornetzi]|uniref:Uncharacterized protein n=1 Tax=Trachymyrmex cornetzi TaxID=471704 RepID=A0A151J5M7_9HYME|nr:hypothetical protein ALC57_09270 [Trachymyrmex cornetzi]
MALFMFTFISHAITSRSSRRKAPKNGTTGHSGIARARASACSYSEDKRAEERYSMTGMRSFMPRSCQIGFSLLDLQRKQYSFAIRRGRHTSSDIRN